MPEFLRIALPALIALLGTLTAALLGYRQWRKQQEQARFGSFLTERQTAYKELWEKLEAVHLYVRTEEFQEAAFQALVRSANMHMISAGLHLRDGEKERAKRYLEALEELGRCLANASASEAREEARGTMYATGALPPRVLQAVRGLKEAYDRVEAERRQVILHFREILGAPFFD